MQTAKRELAEECGSELKVDFLSNTPWAFHSYHHPQALYQSSGFVGTKVNNDAKNISGHPTGVDPRPPVEGVLRK